LLAPAIVSGVVIIGVPSGAFGRGRLQIRARARLGQFESRFRVSFFMNRFRKLGLIEYNGPIQVHRSLLNVVLLDQLPEHKSEKPQLAAVV